MIGRRSHDDAQAFEDAWSGRTSPDAHVADLVRFAENLCEAAAAEPSLHFRTSLRSQIMAEADVLLVPMPRTARHAATTTRTAPPLRRRAAGLTAAMIASAGIVSLVASSASAVPGDMLYPVKRGVETVELSMHRDEASQGSFQLTQASERLSEARELSQRSGSDALIAKSLDDFASSAADGSDKLFAAYTDGGQKESIRTVNDFAAAASVDLSDISASMPSGADESFAAATAAVSNLASQSSSLCATCTPVDIGALASAVTGLASQMPSLPSAKPSKASDTSAKPTATTPAKPSAPVSTSPAPSPSQPVALPTKLPQLPVVSAVPVPVIGGLLGDGTQVGLVPGLLNGLLGGGK